MAERFRREDRMRGHRSGENRGEPESGFRSQDEQSRGFGARGEPERGFRSQAERYGGFAGRYSPRSGYEREPFGYGAEPGEGRYAGEREYGEYERPYGFGSEYERAYPRPRAPEASYGWTPTRGYVGGLDRDRERGSAFGWGGQADRGGEEERGWFERAGDEVASWFGDEEAERRRQRDNMRGRGPKGYARSDERIREDICDELTEDPTLDASDIEVNVSNGEVTLSGTVEDREDKRHAEDAADSILGVKNVQNNLRVEETRFGGAREFGATTGTAGKTRAPSGAREPERS